MEGAAECMALSSLNDARALGERIGNVLLDLLQSRPVDQRPEKDTLVETVAGLQLADSCRKFF
jgi:hypothetical protein